MQVRNSGYSQHGASRNKISMVNWYADSKSPHEDISENLDILRRRSRDLYSGGGPLGRGAIDRIVLNAVGNGLRLNVRIDPELLGMTEESARKWASKVEALFDDWAVSKQASYDNTLNFYEMQNLALKCVLLDGDCFVLMRQDYDSLKLQLIEGERVQVPYGPERKTGVMIDEGIELDELGRPVAIYVANRNPESEIINQPALKYSRIPYYGEYSLEPQIIHLMNPERINQRRGVPLLSPVIELLKQLSRYTEAELMAAVVSGIYAIFFEHEQRESGTIGSEEYASEEGLGGLDGLENITQKELYGTIMDLPEGVHANAVAPGRPNQNFNAFIESLVRQVGGCLGIPSEVLLLHFTSSYSASRGALLEAWKVFRYWRKWFSDNFCQPVYEIWLKDMLLFNKIEFGEAYKSDHNRQKLYTWASWTGPSQGQLDPVKEVNAAVLRVKNGFSTYQRETGELTGEDYDLNIQQLKREELLRNV